MQVSGSGAVHGAHALQGPHGPRGKAAAAPAQAPQRSTPVDQLDISAEAASAADTQEIRTDRVAEIRAQIAGGVYETPGKLEAAVDRLLDELG
ncbi:MAG: flagellar biosynthesis anti-sigma factor FlgM [Planctomycetota bacterium]